MSEKTQASSFYQHFAVTERPTVDYFVGLFNQFVFKQDKILTDFLNPREQFILKTIVGYNAQLEFFGGFTGAERKRAIIASYEESITPYDFGVQVLEVEYNQKFNKIEHRNLYGTIVNLGLELNVFGDLIHDEQDNWQFLVNQKNAAYVESQMTKVGSVKVNLVEKKLGQLLVQTDESTMETILVSSLRLDNVVSSVTKMSRSQVKDQLLQKLIKINWLATQDSNIMVRNSDVISVRHFGRFQIIGEVGETKRGKHRLEIKIWRSKRKRVK